MVYPYAGIPLTPGIAQRLIVEHHSGSLVTRQALVESIPARHVELGGLPSGAKSVTGVIKKALRTLVVTERATRSEGVRGYYRIVAPRGGSSDLKPASSERGTVMIADDPFHGAEYVLGSGRGWVYLVCYPTQRTQAAKRGERAFPHKVGYTMANVRERLYGEGVSLLPEHPEVVLLLRSDRAREMESYLKSKLRTYGLTYESAPGHEWFITSGLMVARLIVENDPRIKVIRSPVALKQL